MGSGLWYVIPPPGPLKIFPAQLCFFSDELCVDHLAARRWLTSRALLQEMVSRM